MKDVEMYTVIHDGQSLQVVDVEMFNAAIDKGYPAPMAADIVNKGLAYLKLLGEVICKVLDFAPTHEASFDWPVNNNCTLVMSVKKK